MNKQVYNISLKIIFQMFSDILKENRKQETEEIIGSRKFLGRSSSLCRIYIMRLYLHFIPLGKKRWREKIS